MQKYKLFGEVSGLPICFLWQPCQYYLLALILSIFWFYRTAIVKIGKRCIIAAGSVVIRDIPDDTMAAGNPAVVKKRLG